ncbi:PQQ-like domain containing protein [Dinothrombium tinctorium]|uniref:PQQ-like domain containing protein n=1 Tax=Dinothrombium tinctorium TaxID=1965070 RepID=A0A3S3RRZ2_9ACAR|nr:PQQ-like domain containing protein [Dinothrombium tinctorium]RWS02287.1 PQQ-like domain containing protein [Dinothrombium tinctorium]RWS03868.1 PQQ-like domain containing protein [Dinothrombium tinctorium]
MFTGADAAYYPSVVCEVYFNQSQGDEENVCGGGVMALEGNSGQVLWNRYTKHEIFAVNCQKDLTDDDINDCVVGGRMASIYAINGANGEIIWTLSARMGEPISETSNFYTPLYVSKDIDEDGKQDLVLMHGGDPLRRPTEEVRLPARLIVVSAKTGIILSWSIVPDKAESYYSPQEIKDQNGNSQILFGTGGETHPGSLYLINLNDLLRRQMHRAKILFSDCCKGIMAPPVLIDLNGDTNLDIVISLFNSTVIAIDGKSHKIMWRSVFPRSETTPAVGYFNNDSIPDFFVIYQHGPGFPIYHYTEATILNGQTGESLLNEPIKMLVGTQSSPLTISTNGQFDIFLYWFSSCNVKDLKINEETEPFRIMPGTSIHDASRADFCAIRFNSTLFTRLIAVSANFSHVVYDSELSRDVEMKTLNYSAIGQKWLQAHSEQRLSNDDYYDSQQNSYLQSENPSNWQLAEDNKYIRALRKRHVGLHDGDGVQRVISTGTLGPSSQKHSIDLIFATYWFPPARNVQLMPPEMQRCIDRYMAPELEANLRLLAPNSKLYGFDHDSYQDFVNSICRQETNQAFVISEHQQYYNPFGREMGSMTVYRNTLSCNHRSFKPFEQQIWPSYLGINANSIANV